MIVMIQTMEVEDFLSQLFRTYNNFYKEGGQLSSLSDNVYNQIIYIIPLNFILRTRPNCQKA